jgi:hypothetical protein
MNEQFEQLLNLDDGALSEVRTTETLGPSPPDVEFL